MRKIKFNFNLKNSRLVKETSLEKKRIAGAVPVYLRLTIDGKRSEFSINEFIDPKRWDKNTQRVKGEKEDAQIINRHLDTIELDIRKIFDSLKETNEIITPRRIIDIYDECLDNIEIPKDLYEKLAIIDTKIVFNGLCEKCKK